MEGVNVQHAENWRQYIVFRPQDVATLVFEVSSRVLKVFEKYTELLCSVAFILVNTHSLAPSANVYDVYFLPRLDRNYWVEN